jgi:DNA polymerase I-like protein with 3'-5' exonuclease and polymerase domains
LQVVFNNREYPFQPWTPDMGQVFKFGYAFDSETTLIDIERPWIAPALVLAAAFDGKSGYFLTRQTVVPFLQVHRDVAVTMHNAPFDLAVIHAMSPQIDIYDFVDRNRVWDTQVLHRLYVLATDGHTARGKGESTLERCVGLYLGAQLPKDVVDEDGQPVRLSYGKWLNKSPAEIDPVYLDYLAKDVISTFQVRLALRQRLIAILQQSHNAWGFVSHPWIKDQIRRWGLQTHHIQLRAAIVLSAITGNGLHLDSARRDTLVANLQTVSAERRKFLADQGYLASGEGSSRALQSILTKLEVQHREVNFPRTETGKYRTSADALHDLIDLVPFVRQLFEFRATEKLLGSFLDKMSRTLHPSFNVLCTTGRTSSYGDVNAQNLPTDDRVRSCFIPSPGHVFIDADYKTIEMATLAQACVSQFRFTPSHMADAINAGKDLHRLVAARVTGKSEAEVTNDERKSAKPINFGKPGGMSNRTLKVYAKTTYGVDLDDDHVAEFSDAWFEEFPEMRDFLAKEDGLGREVAALLDLTPASHNEHTGDRRFVDHHANQGRQQEPHGILGSMCLKVLRDADPKLGNGDPYNPADIDFFWARLQVRRDLLPHQVQHAIDNRKASTRLWKAMMSLVDRRGVFTLTGRLRGNANYCARHNSVFQGLAADGAKLALWRLWRTGFRIVNFIHDQVLIEVPADSDLKAHADQISGIMISAMHEVVPDVAVGVSVAATDRWYKDAEASYDADGKLILWQPPAKSTASPRPSPQPPPSHNAAA